MIAVAHTDVGIKKKVNQDSLIVRKSKLNNDKTVFLAAVCDGMGGLSNGEYASKEAVNCLSRWFNSSLPELLKNGLSNNSLKKSLNTAIFEVDTQLNAYGQEEECGTTIAGIFIYNGKYACVNVGDSRVYLIRGEEIKQLTHDQTVVQKELDDGLITQEEAENSSQKSVLLQCVGAGGDVVPDYTYGEYRKNDVFIVCSDGFRHKLSENQIKEMFSPDKLQNKKSMDRAALAAIEYNKQEKERDNISVIAIKI